MSARRHTVIRSRRRTTRTLLVRVFSGVTLTLLLCMSIYGVWRVTRLPSLTLSEFKIDGLETIPESDITQQINAVLSGSYFALIPKKFLYFYPGQALVSTLKNMRRVEDVTVTRNGTALLIAITEYKPFGLWCSAATSTANACFFVDTHGKAYAEAPLLTGSTLSRFIIEGSTPKLNDAMLSGTEIERLTLLTESFKRKLGLTVAVIRVTKDRDVFLSLTTGGEIRIGPEDSAEKIFSNLSSILGSDAYKNLKKGGFEYIDLRFGNKIFVEKNAALDTSTTSSQALPTVH